MQRISGLSRIADRYDIVLCDVWGVIHNGRESFPAACDALAVFQAERGPVVLISNAPRPSAAVHDQLRMLGVPDAAWSGFVTSGDATRALLAARAPGPVWKLGPDRDDPLYAGLDLEFSGLEAAAFICCTGPFDDLTETPEDYRERFEAAAARRLAFICANPDRVVQRGDQLIYCAGALADLYARLGGEEERAVIAPVPVRDHQTPQRQAGRAVVIGDDLGLGAKAEALQQTVGFKS